MNDAARQSAPWPILIRALSGRSGTNHLFDLVAAHRDVARIAMPEDYLMTGAEALEGYAERLAGIWQRFWPAKDAMDHYAADPLLARLGEALVAHLAADPNRPVPPDKHPLLKTPSLYATHLTFRLFPSARLLILLRDPRSIAESHRRSHWGGDKSLERYGAEWARHARWLGTFLSANQAEVRSGRIRLVRYERLVEDPEGSVESLFAGLGLQPDPDAVARARTAPVIGSSFMPRNGEGQVDFKPQPRPTEFEPLRRWAHWSAAEHRRFNRVCGASMRRWGYDPVERS